MFPGQDRGEKGLGIGGCWFGFKNRVCATLLGEASRFYHNKFIISNINIKAINNIIYDRLSWSAPILAKSL